MFAINKIETTIMALLTCALGITINGEPYDFKGIELGMSKNAFRELPHPDGGTAKVVCTNDAAAATPTTPQEMMEQSGFDTLAVGSKYGNAGLSECSWFTDWANMPDASGKTFGDVLDARLAQSLEDSLGENFLDVLRLNKGWHVVPMSMAASGFNAPDPEFLFTPDAKGVERLYRIRMTADPSAASDVLKALVAKWGAPNISDNVDPPELPIDLQGVFEPVASGTYVWTKDDSTIVMSAALSEMSLMFVHHVLARVANQRLDDLLGRMRNPI